MTDKKSGLTYRDAGVNIDAAEVAVSRIKEDVRRTFDANVLQDLGSFGAMYRFDTSTMEEPVIVASMDGVGTKLKLAFLTGVHNTVGIDLVSHCVNDILVQGAKPLFFLDYLAAGKLEPDVIADVIRGLATGCRHAGCSLIGGETAEMPGMYADGEYDLAGTIVGVVDRGKIVDGSRIEAGDIIVGLQSTGLHTNGYSLARKICFDVAGLGIDAPLPGTGRTVAEALREPHRSYARSVQLLSRIVKIKGMSHITGGGITDNLPRSIPKHLGARIDLSSWEVPALFAFLQRAGEVETREMLRTFNMGLGYLIIISREDREKALDAFDQFSEDVRVIGEVVEGPNKVTYEGEARYAPTD